MRVRIVAQIRCTIAAVVICNDYIAQALHVWCAGGRSEFIQLELDMFRMTALFVVERNKAQLLGELFKLLKLSAQAARHNSLSRSSRWLNEQQYAQQQVRYCFSKELKHLPNTCARTMVVQ